jgi:Na+-transporting methylmalonyl-CoA/oxaloacetate decarboxylase gamma subunit
MKEAEIIFSFLVLLLCASVCIGTLVFSYNVVVHQQVTSSECNHDKNTPNLAQSTK